MNDFLEKMWIILRLKISTYSQNVENVCIFPSLFNLFNLFCKVLKNGMPQTEHLQNPIIVVTDEQKSV